MKINTYSPNYKAMKNLSVSLIGCGRIGFLLEEDPSEEKTLILTLVEL
jgi:hypothetical protein